MAKSQAQLLLQQKETLEKQIEECYAQIHTYELELKTTEAQLKIADILEHPENLEKYIQAEAQKIADAQNKSGSGTKHVDRSIIKTKAVEVIGNQTTDFKVMDIVDSVFEGLSVEEQNIHPKDVVKQTLTVWLPKQADKVKQTGVRGYFRKVQ